MRKAFWRMLFYVILMIGLWALIPASEIARARQWVEMILGWTR